MLSQDFKEFIKSLSDNDWDIKKSLCWGHSILERHISSLVHEAFPQGF